MEVCWGGVFSRDGVEIDSGIGEMGELFLGNSEIGPIDSSPIPCISVYSIIFCSISEIDFT